MYVVLVDKDGFESPALYIHCDEEEFLAEIEKWKADLLTFVRTTLGPGMPLTRLEAETCMLDLVGHLVQYYKDTAIGSMDCGHVLGTLFLAGPQRYPLQGKVVRIKTYE